MKKEIFKNYEIKIRPIKIIKFNLRWRKVRLGLPSFFLSHTSFSILFETLSSLLCLRITYQQDRSGTVFIRCNYYDRIINIQ